MKVEREDLLDKAEKYLSHGVPSITTNDDKKPTLDTWTDIRDSRKLPSKELLTQWLTNPLVTHIAIVSRGRFLIIDYDGLGEQRLRNRILPICSTSIQDKFERTTRTKTPHGGHTLIARDPKNYDTKVEEIEAWKLTGDELEHQEVLLLSSEKYVVERGPGYEPVRDIEVLEQFTKDEEIEFCEKLREVKGETKFIRIIIKKLVPYYEKSNRDKLVFAFSGYAHKYGVPETLIHDTIEDLMDMTDGDEERESRFKVISETCQKPREEVSGRQELLDAVDNDDSVILVIQQQYKKLRYFKFENENVEDDKTVSENEEETEDTTIVTAMLQLIQGYTIKLFTNKHETPYITVLINNEHLETIPIKSGRFRKWVARLGYKEMGKSIKSGKIREIIDLLQADALFDGETIDLKV